MVEFSIEALTLHLKVYCLTRFLFLFFCIKLLLLVCLLVVVFQHRESNTRYSGHRLGGQKVREGEATGSLPPSPPESMAAPSSSEPLDPVLPRICRK